MNSDFKELLSIFNANNVRYLVVGGYAVMKYTEPRFTKYFDLWISPDAENAEAVFKSLREFGAPLEGRTPASFTQKNSFYQMGRPPARVDILMSIDGVGFEDAWARHETTDFDGVPARIISRLDLIANKQASGRLQDLMDLENLKLSARVKGDPGQESEKRK